MILNFSEENYNTLKKVNFSEIGSGISFDDSKRTVELLETNEDASGFSNLDLFQVIINEEIVAEGMDDQETVNQYGLKLYKAYDEMLYQLD